MEFTIWDVSNHDLIKAKFGFSGIWIRRRQWFWWQAVRSRDICFHRYRSRCISVDQRTAIGRSAFFRPARSPYPVWHRSPWVRSDKLPGRRCRAHFRTREDSAPCRCRQSRFLTADLFFLLHRCHGWRRLGIRCRKVCRYTHSSPGSWWDGASRTQPYRLLSGWDWWHWWGKPSCTIRNVDRVLKIFLPVTIRAVW